MFSEAHRNGLADGPGDACLSGLVTSPILTAEGEHKAADQHESLSDRFPMIS